MLGILKMSLVFVAMVIMIRRKMNIGIVLLISSVLVIVFYQMPVQSIAAALVKTLTDPVTIALLFALTLIRMLEMILREQEIMKRMMETSRGFLRSKRAVIVSMPLLIGMLPSLGGAYFSAPMVAESTKDLVMSADEKAFINYWYRHPWEFMLPLYPGLILASALTSIGLRNLIIANTTYAITVVLTGFLFSMRRLRKNESPVDKKVEPGPPMQRNLFRDLACFIPLILVLSFVIVFSIDLHYALGITVACLLVWYRYPPQKIFDVFKYGFARDVLILIFSLMFFKFIMDDSGAVKELSSFFVESGVPVTPVLIILPFTAGLLTGLTVGFVGSTFPLLMSITGGAHLNQVTLAFASGLIGVLLSPVHLCLILTREYFSADLWGIYKRVLPSCIAIMVAALALSVLLK